MRASEWQYLCAVHDPPKPCCAIDYCCHTLDWAGNVLSSPKYFSSRLTLGEGGNVAASMRHLTNIFRRVYRIFAHAWFQHRGVFWQVEGRDGVYIFFKTVCDVYQLVPEDNYTIPVEAEVEAANEEHWDANTPVSLASTEAGSHKMQILTKNDAAHAEEAGSQIHSSGKQQHEQEGETATTTTVSVGATTRRHKHTPSTGSQVATIVEGMEEEDGNAGELQNVEDEDETQGESYAPGPSIPFEQKDTQSRPQGQGLLSEALLSAHGLAKLDLSAESLPELHVPEDPTPLASHTTGYPMASLVTANAGAMDRYGQEGKEGFEDKVAGLNIEEARAKNSEMTEGEPGAAVKDGGKDTDMENLSKKVVQESQETNVSEAEPDDKVDEGTTVAPGA